MHLPTPTLRAHPAAHPPSGVVLLAGQDEPVSVLRARCRDGHLVQVVDGLFVPADLAAWPVARAAALRSLLRVGWAGGLTTSVWCRGGPPRTLLPPTGTHGLPGEHEVDLLAPPTVGGRARDGVRLRLVPLAGSDVEHVHGTPVTTAVRTGADLVLWGTARDDAALAWLWEHGTDPALVAEDLTARGPVPGLARAARVLRAVRAGRPEPLARHPLPSTARAG